VRSRGPGQLPPGRHGFSRGFVQQNQRARILAAVAEATAASSFAETSVESIIGHAGVSRRTFYEHFRNKHEAFLAAYDDASARLVRQVVAAVEHAEGFAERAYTGLQAMLTFLATEPAVARMCIVEVMAAGPEAIARRSDSMRAFARLVERYASELLDHHAPVLTAETIVGGIYEVVYTRVLHGHTEELPKLLPDLTYSVLLPYLGQAAAIEERRRLQEGA
jgi:AcrR family transcriptional regulator